MRPEYSSISRTSCCRGGATVTLGGCGAGRWPAAVLQPTRRAKPAATRTTQRNWRMQRSWLGAIDRGSSGEATRIVARVLPRANRGAPRPRLRALIVGQLPRGRRRAFDFDALFGRGMFEREADAVERD